jgi:hypothetical protein
MADVEFEDSDFAAATSHLHQAGAAAVDPFCVSPGALGAEPVAAALGDVDALIRHAAAALAGVALELSADVDTVHNELRALDARMAGVGG